MTQRNNQERILIFLSRKSPSRIGEIVDEAVIKRISSQVFLKRLTELGFIERVGYGQYSITEKGKEEAKKILTRTDGKINQEEKTEIKEEDNHSDTTLKNIDDIDLIIQLKKRYGNEELIKRLKKMIKLLE
ncbi:hypothetical protein HYW20_08735 [Candidatus Woesearchaeota archaeon]|nr:hypothetical protein [Candidatus Woesearchaeota archaeon]